MARLNTSGQDATEAGDFALGVTLPPGRHRDGFASAAAPGRTCTKCRLGPTVKGLSRGEGRGG